MRKLAVAVLLTTTIAAGAAFAQSTNNTNNNANMPSTSMPSSSAVGSVNTHQEMWRSSKLIGVNVYNRQNEKLGDINEVLLDKSGKVAGFVLGVGGFLGMGEHDILVSMDKLQFVDQPMRTARAMVEFR